MSGSLKTRILMGAAGGKPRIDVFDIHTGVVSTRIDLPDGHGVYAMGNAPAGDRWAVGTQGGLLYYFVENDSPDNQEPQIFIQGAPVLSITFVDAAMWAAADAYGRCWLWDLRNRKKPPKSLPIGGKVICSLLAIPPDTLVGLSTEGELHFWQMPNGKLILVEKSPRPPRLGALVNLIYLPESQSILYPVEGGALALYAINQQSLRTIPAHTDDFYAVIRMEDGFITAGIGDHTLKRWPGDFDTPQIEVSTSAGIIAAFGMGEELLLVNERGEAGIYALTTDKLECIQTLPGEEYRSVIGPTPDDVTKIRQALREEEAQQLIQEIQTRIDRESDEPVEDFHNRLVELGYETISLALQAEQAARREDRLSEFCYRRQLALKLPMNDPGARISLERCAELYIEFGHISQAYDLYSQLQATAPNPQWEPLLQSIIPYQKILLEEDWVIESEMELSLLIQSSTVVGAPFHGRYRINTLDSFARKLLNGAAHTVLEKYEQVRRETSGLPPGWRQTYWWLSFPQRKSIETLIFREENESESPAIQFGLQAIPIRGGVQLVPFTMFVAPPPHRTISPVEHNQSILKSYTEQLENQEPVHSRIQQIHHAVEEALDRLENHEKSRRWKS